jgi:hypothetical protein
MYLFPLYFIITLLYFKLCGGKSWVLLSQMENPTRIIYYVTVPVDMYLFSLYFIIAALYFKLCEHISWDLLSQIELTNKLH